MNKLLITGLAILLIGIAMPKQEASEIEHIKLGDNPSPNGEVETYVIDEDNTMFDQFSKKEIGYSNYEQVKGDNLERPEFLHSYFYNQHFNGHVFFVSTMQYQDNVYLEFTIEIGQDEQYGPYIYSVGYDFIDEHNRSLFIPTQKGIPYGDGSHNGSSTSIGEDFHQAYVDPIILNNYYSSYIDDFMSLSKWYSENNLNDNLEDIVVPFPTEEELGLQLLDYNKMKLLYDNTIALYAGYYNFED